MREFRKRCRESVKSIYAITHDSQKFRYSSTLSGLGKTLMGTLPAIFYGCTAEDLAPSAWAVAEEVRLNLTKSIADQEIESLDIFIFKDDDLRLLDCYQRVEKPAEWNGGITSSPGEIIVSVCANSGILPDEWPLIRSRGALGNIKASLENERRNTPVMSGEMHLIADNRHPDISEISLRPLVSEIYLRSICCDFKGKAYEGYPITDVRIYLTNINAECGILENTVKNPERILNSGKLRQEDLDGFNDPGLIYLELEEELDRAWTKPEARLWCYPSNPKNDTPGSPFTRLVIEGKVGGTTYFWPININRGEDGNGVERNMRYIYDIRITGKGSTDPDVPVDADNMVIKMRTERWEEKENYTVGF